MIDFSELVLAIAFGIGSLLLTLYAIRLLDSSEIKKDINSYYTKGAGEWEYKVNNCQCDQKSKTIREMQATIMDLSFQLREANDCKTMKDGE